VGGLCLPASYGSASTASRYYTPQWTRKQHNKNIESIDPDAMEIACDYDLWLLLEAQRVFAPFSYKTHDMNVLNLQGITPHLRHLNSQRNPLTNACMLLMQTLEAQRCWRAGPCLRLPAAALVVARAPPIQRAMPVPVPMLAAMRTPASPRRAAG
jgi:hypothetical protein